MGTDFDAITRSANYNVVIGRDDAEVQQRLDWIKEHYESVLPADRAAQVVDEYRSGPAVGTPEQIVQTLRELQDVGMTYAICYFADAAYDRSGIELFEREVASALR